MDEAVTRVADGHVPDEVFEEAHRHFNDTELVSLTLCVVAINGWNRLNIAFRTPAGSYQPGKRPMVQPSSRESEAPRGRLSLEAGSLYLGAPLPRRGECIDRRHGGHMFGDMVDGFQRPCFPGRGWGGV